MHNPHWSFQLQGTDQSPTAQFTPMDLAEAATKVADLHPTADDPLTQQILQGLNYGRVRTTRSQLDSALLDQQRKRESWDDFTTKLDQASSIAIHTVEVEDSARGLSRITEVVLMVIHDIKDDAGAAVAFVIRTVEEAVGVVVSLFKKVAVTVEKVINFIKGLFNWHDILNTQSVIEWHIKQFITVTQAYISIARNEVNDKLENMKTALDTPLNNAIAHLGNEKMSHGQRLARHSQPKDMQASYVQHHMNNNMGSDQVQFNIDTGNLNALAGTTAQNLQSNISAHTGAFDNKFAHHKTGLAAIMDNIDSFVNAGLADLLEIIKALIDEAIDLIKAGMNDVFDFLHDLLEEFKEIMTTHRIVIPFLTPLYENVITEGQEQLTLLSLMSLDAAIVATITYKIANLSDEPMFNAAEKEHFTTGTFESVYGVLPSRNRAVRAPTKH